MKTDRCDSPEDDDLPESPPEVGLDDEEAAEDDTPAMHAVVVAPVDELRTVLAAELSTDATQRYLNRIGMHPLLSADEELRFSTLAKGGEFAARQKMIEHNLRLVDRKSVV